MRRTIVFPVYLLLACAGLLLNYPIQGANRDGIRYVEIEPIIVTNYLRPKGKKPGFVQVQAQLTAEGKSASDIIEDHMPLIRAVMIEYLSFTEEATIKDLNKRIEIRDALLEEIKLALTDVVGENYADSLVFTHFIYD